MVPQEMTSLGNPEADTVGAEPGWEHGEPRHWSAVGGGRGGYQGATRCPEKCLDCDASTIQEWSTRFSICRGFGEPKSSVCML